MPKTEGECIPRVKKTTAVVEDGQIRSKAIHYTAYSSTHPLYHSSINSWPQLSKNHYGNYAEILQRGVHSLQEEFPKET